MKKRSLQFSILVVLISILLLTSSSNPDPNAMPSDKDNASKLLLDAGFWHTLSGVTTNYVKLEDINPKAVPEIKLGMNIDILGGFIVQETTDGILCGYEISPLLSYVSSEVPKNTPKIRKLDKQGNILWDKQYDFLSISGQINNLVAYPDGSYVFSVQTYPHSRDRDLVFEKSLIIKCDKDGRELWKQEFEDYSGDLFRYLYLTEKEEIIAVGQWLSHNGKQTSNGAADIVVTKLAKDGKVLQQKGFGGNGFENLRFAQYDKELGIIINGTTTSRDGDFGIREDLPYADFVACLDESLTCNWVVQSKEKERFVYDQLALADGFIYLLGIDQGRAIIPATEGFRNYVLGDDQGVGSSAPVSQGFLIQIDKSGNRVWKKSHLYTDWGSTMSNLQNGDIVIASGQQNQGIMLILDKNGQEKKGLEDLKFVAKEIMPTQDGGFIVTAIREIKTIPQPAYVSSIWSDTELVAVKYKNDYSVEWRKTYDRHKDIKGLDYVFPLENGKIIVEGLQE
ncbi:hypothetical protein [Desulfosporosinus nitroreducens]|uniref:hypothetical protein n=1 Tax=Desulfosporosinus nitroreducens TaxID=2018668 RepID=UPI00207D157A|nr:hypothetical protein [Desulfosporosinus nitroreducens]MCO1603884.1 hypothetical protein [Desulfosporosinus nitroreducens]